MILKQLNDAVEYIEHNLEKDLSLDDISEHAGLPKQHFRNIFMMISGMSVAEYIKKRRLALANESLVSGGSVTSVATHYGYSLDGFTRAFQAWSGYLPSEIHKSQTLVSFPKLTFYIDVKGGENMEVRIVDMPAFKFAGVEKRVPMQFEGVNQEIEKLVASITGEQQEEMNRLQNIEPKQVVNVSYDADENFLKDAGYLTHMIGVLTTDDSISEQLETFDVPANKWAVFPNEGEFPKVMQDTTARAAAEWLPSTDYTLSDVPNFSFTIMSEDKEDHAYSEIWMAIE